MLELLMLSRNKHFTGFFVSKIPTTSKSEVQFCIYFCQYEKCYFSNTYLIQDFSIVSSYTKESGSFQWPLNDSNPGFIAFFLPYLLQTCKRGRYLALWDRPTETGALKYMLLYVKYTLMYALDNSLKYSLPT